MPALPRSQDMTAVTDTVSFDKGAGSGHWTLDRQQFTTLPTNNAYDGG